MSICLNRLPPIKIKKNRFATEAEAKEEEEEAKKRGNYVISLE